MIIFAIAALKGGTGKSMVALHLAGALAQKGRVGLIDTDPQGSPSSFRARLETASPPIIACRPDGLRRRLDQARQDRLDFVVIDTPPQTSSGLIACLTAADIVLIPTRAALLDVVAIAVTIRLVNELQKPFGVVTNAAPRQQNAVEAPLVVEARQRLRGVGARLWKGQITHRLELSSALIEGRTIHEAEPGGPSAREMNSLARDFLRQSEALETARKRRKCLAESAPAVESAEARADPAHDGVNVPSPTSGRRGILVRVSPETRKALRLVALRRDNRAGSDGCG